MKKIYKLCLLVAGLFVGTQMVNAQIDENTVGWGVKKDGVLIYENNNYFVVYDTQEKKLGTYSNKTLDYPFTGPGSVLSFNASKQSLGTKNIVVTETGGKELFNFEAKTSYPNTLYSKSITSHSIRNIQFSGAATLNKYIKDVKVTMAKYIEFAGGANSIDLAIPNNEIHKDGTNAKEGTITFDWCNVNDLQILCEDPNFEVVNADAEFSRVGAWGSSKLTIRCLHQAVKKHEATITIYSETTGQKLTINVSSETTKKTPTFTWDIPRTMSLGEVKENVVWVTTGAGELSLVAAEPDTLLVEGLKVTAIGVGTTTLTASVLENGEFYAADSTISITVDNKLRQTITWDQNIAIVPITTSTIELTASVNTTLPLVYTSSNTDVATVDGNVLTIVGVGNTNITAAVEGDDAYFPVFMTKGVMVYDPDEACPDFPLAGGAFDLSQDLFASGTSQQSLTWDAAKPAGELVFDVIGEIEWPFENEDITLSIDVYRNGSNSKENDWQKITVSTKDSGHYSIPLDENISGVNFRLDYMAGRSRTVKLTNIAIYQKNYLYTTADAVTFNPLNLNASNSKEITLSFSALPSMCGIALEKEDKVFSLAGGLTFGQGCGTVGTDKFTVKFSSIGLTTADCGTYENAILVKNLQGGEELRIPISGKVEQLAQVIEWTPENKTIKPSAQLTLPATTDVNLPIVYSTSDEATAYVNDQYELVILKHGTVTITANAAGNDLYQAALSVAHTFTIEPITYTVTVVELGTIEAGTTLADITLQATATDEAGNTVEGTIAWADATIVPEAGTTAEYDVIFTPANTNYYAESNHKVSVSVNKLTQTISWEAVTELKTIETITLSASTAANLPIVYETSDAETAYVNEQNELVVLKAGVVTITAKAEGNEQYEAAEPVAKEFIIRYTHYELTINDIDELIAGQPLGTLTLTATATDEAGNEVEGMLVFAEPDVVPTEAGEFEVIFTPTNAGWYELQTTTVMVNINNDNLGTSVENTLADNIIVFAQAAGFGLQTTRTQTIVVYTISGHVIYDGMLVAGERLNIAAVSGTYILRTATDAQKINVR